MPVFSGLLQVKNKQYSFTLLRSYGSHELKKKAERDTEKGRSHEPVSQKRSRAIIKALKKEPTNTVSSSALSKQATSAAKQRSSSDRSKAAATRKEIKSNKTIECTMHCLL